MRLYYKMNILTTVTESADKIAMDAVEHDSSQLSPASEQERAVLKNGNELDVEEDDKVDLINGDTNKRSDTPLSSSPTISKVNEDIEEGCKETSTSINGATSAEKHPLLSKITIVNSNSPTTSSKTPNAKLSSISMMTPGKGTTAKSRNTTVDKKEPVRLKLKSSLVSNPKPISLEAKNPTPIKSYLSISSILGDIDKPEVSKKQLPKHPRKSSDDSNNVPVNPEIPDTKLSLVPSPSAEPMPKTTAAATTNDSERIHSSLASDTNLLKPIVAEPLASQPVISVLAKTEPVPSTPNSVKKALVMTSRRKSTTSSGSPRTLVTTASNSSTTERAAMVVSTANGGESGRKTPILPVGVPSPSVKISIPVKSPNTRTPVPVKSPSLKTPVSAQSTTIKTPVLDQNCGKKTAVPAPKSPGVKTATSTSLLLPNSGTKILELTSASVPSSGTKTSLDSSSVSSPGIKRSNVKTSSLTSVSMSSTSSSSVQTTTSPSASALSTEIKTSASASNCDAKAPTVTSAAALCFEVKTKTSTPAPTPCSDVKTPTLPSEPLSCPTDKTPFLTSVSSASQNTITSVSTSTSSPNIGAKSSTLTSASSLIKTSTSSSISSPGSIAKVLVSTSAPLPIPSKKMPSMTFVSTSNVNAKTTTIPTTITISSITSSVSKRSVEMITATVPSKAPFTEVISSKASVTTLVRPAVSSIAISKSASTTVTSSMKSTPIFSSLLPMMMKKPPPPLVPASSKVPISSIKVNTSSSMVVTTSLAKSLSIPSSTSITVSSKSLPPPLITLTSTSTTSTLVTSKELAASQYIPANTKIPSSLEISFSNSKETAKQLPVNSSQKLVQQNFTNGVPLANGAPKSNHIIGKKTALNDKAGVKRAFNNDKKSIGEPEKKMSRQGNETLSVATNGAPKKVFSPNILPEVSITLNTHPEQNKRISPETSYDVSCFKPNDSVLNNVPPLTPINAPICKNIQNSPIKNLNNKKLPSNGVRIIRNSSSASMANKLKHSLTAMEKQNGEPEVKKPVLENGSQYNGVFESLNGKEKSSSPEESASAPLKSNETKTPSPASAKKEARHQGIPKLIDIKAAPYSKLIAQDAKARLQFLKNTLYVNPSAEPATNSDNALDLSSPSSSKSPSSDKSEPSPEKRKLISSVPPHMIPVTMAKNDMKSPTIKTSPTLSKIERKPSPIAKLDKSPARKTDFRLDNGSSSTPISRSPRSPIFPKTPSPMGPLHFSPPLNPALALNFLHQQQQQYNRDLVWLMDAFQNGQLPSHPLMHKNLKPPTPTSEAAFHAKK